MESTPRGPQGPHGGSGPGPDAWPADLRAWLDGSQVPRRAGHLGSAEGRGAWRVGAPGSSVIVKIDLVERERRVYAGAVATLRNRGVDVPEVLAQGGGPPTWIAFEDVGPPLPRSRWELDPEVLDTLGCLHAIEARWWQAVVGEPFQPVWTPEMDSTALSALRNVPARDRFGLLPVLTRLREAAPALLSGTVPLSGDPNPTNWVIRPNVGIVLVDWERAGVGSPAVDLAISMPGPGWRTDQTARQVAREYIERVHRAPSLADLAMAIDVAKAWSVAEFLWSGHHPPPQALAAWAYHVRRVAAKLGA